jgi:hypothetical protein
MSNGMQALIILAMVIYAMGVSSLVNEDEFEAYEKAMWPLVFIKFMIKSFFRVLFTGWKS